jgi:hypothetical protein
MTTLCSTYGLAVSLSGDHPQLPALIAALPAAAAPAQLQITLTVLPTAVPPFELAAADHLLEAGSFGLLSADLASGRGLLAAPGDVAPQALAQQLFTLLSRLAAAHGCRPLHGMLVHRGGRAILLQGLSDADEQALAAAAARRGLQLGSARGLLDAQGRLWADDAATPIDLRLSARVVRQSAARSSLQQTADGTILTFGSAESTVTLLDALLQNHQASA